MGSSQHASGVELHQVSDAIRVFRRRVGMISRSEQHDCVAGVRARDNAGSPGNSADPATSCDDRMVSWPERRAGQNGNLVFGHVTTVAKRRALPCDFTWVASQNV